MASECKMWRAAQIFCNYKLSENKLILKMNVRNSAVYSGLQIGNGLAAFKRKSTMSAKCMEKKKTEKYSKSKKKGQVSDVAFISW